MASKKYAYFLKGNKIAIVEQEYSRSRNNLAVAHCTISGYSTKDTCEAAGGQWIPSSSSMSSGVPEDYNYVSPKSSVDTGIELEYTYMPASNLVDESSIVDIPRYQALAIVYYIKAKLAEDVSDFKTREMYLREFKRQIEKNVAARKHGPTVVQGFGMTR